MLLVFKRTILIGPPKDMFNLIDKKIITLLHKKFADLDISFEQQNKLKIVRHNWLSMQFSAVDLTTCVYKGESKKKERNIRKDKKVICFVFNCLLFIYLNLLQTFIKGAQWLSGRVLVSRPRGHGFEPHHRHCVVSLSKTYFSLLSTSSTQEDPSRHN